MSCVNWIVATKIDALINDHGLYAIDLYPTYYRSTITLLYFLCDFTDYI